MRRCVAFSKTPFFCGGGQGADPSCAYMQAFRDPGILPRNLDPDPPSAGTASEESSRVPLPRDLRVRAGV